MSWKGPIFAQGLWPLERPARWTKPFIGQGIKEMLATKVNRYKLIIKGMIMSMIKLLFFSHQEKKKDEQRFLYQESRSEACCQVSQKVLDEATPWEKKGYKENQQPQQQ
jgi:hypothetical protein